MHFQTAVVLAQLQLSGVPVASIGVADGDTMQTLSRVANAIEDRHGNVFVLQIGIPYVAVFDSTGRRIATLGRSGGGPGEFGAPTRVSIVDGDSIWVSDSRLGKLSLFGPDFSHVRDVILSADYAPLSAASTEGRFSGMVPADVLSLGFVVEVRSTVKHYQLFQPWSGRAIELAQFRSDDARMLILEGGRATYLIPPLIETPYITARNNQILRITRRPTPRVTVFTGQGVPVSTSMIDVEPVEVPTDFKRGYIDRTTEMLKARSPSTTRTAFRRKLEETLGLPVTSYFINPGFVSVDGYLWIVQAPPESPARLLELAPTGRIKRTLMIPAGRRILSVRAGKAWVLETDADDVPYLRRYVIS